jgi:hypothetical protein
MEPLNYFMGVFSRTFGGELTTMLRFFSGSVDPKVLSKRVYADYLLHNCYAYPTNL